MKYEVGDRVLVKANKQHGLRVIKIEDLGTIESITSNGDYYVRLYSSNTLTYCREENLSLVLEEVGVNGN